MDPDFSEFPLQLGDEQDRRFETEVAESRRQHAEQVSKGLAALSAPDAATAAGRYSVLRLSKALEPQRYFGGSPIKRAEVLRAVVTLVSLDDLEVTAALCHHLDRQIWKDFEAAGGLDAFHADKIGPVDSILLRDNETQMALTAGGHFKDGWYKYSFSV